MSYAVALKSESSDYYCFSWDGKPTKEQIKDRITCLGSELGYCYLEASDLDVAGLTDQEAITQCRELDGYVLSLIDEQAEKNEENGEY